MLIPTYQNTDISGLADLFLSQFKAYFVMNNFNKPDDENKHFICWNYFNDEDEPRMQIHQYDWKSGIWTEYTGHNELGI